MFMTHHILIFIFFLHNKLWLLLFLCASITTGIFLLMDRVKSGNPSEDGLRTRRDTYVLFVFGNLIATGAQVVSKKTNVQLLAGTWCLATFIIINYYTSILTSFTMASNFKPLVDSIQDLADKENVKLVVPKGTGIENIIFASFYFIFPNEKALFLHFSPE